MEVAGDMKGAVWQSDGVEARLERGKEGRQVAIRTQPLWGIFPGSLASKGRRERGLRVFKVGES